MKCPFPGMDPYLEASGFWPDFHDSLIVNIRGILQPQLRPKYAALVQDRLYLVQSKRPIFPDIAVMKPRRSKRNGNGEVAVLEADKPVIFEVVEEEIRQPYLQIVETATGKRLTTAIEVLSPDNKVPGVGRRMYLKKRREVRQARANLVEIDLLRGGKSTFGIDEEELANLPDWCYLVGVQRRPRRQEVYPIALRKRLPIINIPLGRDAKDVQLDLQAAFTRTWQDGAYPEMIAYDGAPPPELSADDRAWCRQCLRDAGMRSNGR